MGRSRSKERQIDVERHVDGTIDILEALASALKSDPAPQAVEAPSDGSRPFTDGSLDRPQGRDLADRQPRTGRADRGGVDRRLGHDRSRQANRTGGHSRRRGAFARDPLDDRPELDGRVARRPLDGRHRQELADPRPPGRGQDPGRFEGTLDARREKGLWLLKGDAAIVGLEATGPALLGDTLKLDKVVVACDSDQSTTGWTIRKFELTSPVATIQGGGSVPAIDGTPRSSRGGLTSRPSRRCCPTP